MKKILIINGPNLNLLGLREPDIYGRENYDALCEFVRNACIKNGFDCEVFQSNHEGVLVDKIQAAYGVFDGIVINPAAYTHTSVAIPDAIKAVGIPTVEVHLSDISGREEFRRHSFTSAACIATIYGKGFTGYALAIEKLKEWFTEPWTVESAQDGKRIASFLRVSESIFSGEVTLPRRATAGSAGYDFFAPFEISLAPGEEKTIATGIRANMQTGWVLLLFPRSGLGFRYGLSLVNTVGVVDADYFNADNEGHILIRVRNGDKPLQISKGDAFAQGVFVPFGITEDDEANAARRGGFGSTSK